MNELFKNYGIRIELQAKPGEIDPKEKYRDSYHVVKETLTRIGVASEKTKTLYQSCHILHKRGEYAILHFKEVFSFDGKQTDITEEDIARRNLIVNLLEKFKLIKVIDKLDIPKNIPYIKVIPYNDKKNWKLQPKYTIGKKSDIKICQENVYQKSKL